MGAYLREIAHLVFIASLTVYALLGSTFVWTLIQYLRLRRRGELAEAAVLAASLPPDEALPAVLVQAPIFNEGRTVGRICNAIAELDWPRDRLTVQVLDDSTDGSETEAAEAVARLRRAGLEASLTHRTSRRGFKAGALAEGLRCSHEPFVAVFDADYAPPTDFLRRCLKPLIADEQLAFVQARCDYRNGDENRVTRAQQRILDAHYAIEQPVRSWSGQLVAFNGTCGVWRRSAIDDVGGWQGDTLAEDMDLSLRAQLRGWRALFLASVTAPGELPANFRAWRRQQFRWSKGSAEVTRKLLADVWASRRLTLGQKLAGTLQLGGGIFGLMFGVTTIAGLLDVALGRGLSPLAAALIGVLVLEIGVGPMLLQLAGQKVARGRSVLSELPRLPMVMGFYLAVGLTNLGAGFEALLGHASEFQRTPKKPAAPLEAAKRAAP